MAQLQSHRKQWGFGSFTVPSMCCSKVRELSVQKPHQHKSARLSTHRSNPAFSPQKSQNYPWILPYFWEAECGKGNSWAIDVTRTLPSSSAVASPGSRSLAPGDQDLISNCQLPFFLPLFIPSNSEPTREGEISSPNQSPGMPLLWSASGAHLEPVIGPRRSLQLPGLWVPPKCRWGGWLPHVSNLRMHSLGLFTLGWSSLSLHNMIGRIYKLLARGSLI